MKAVARLLRQEEFQVFVCCLFVILSSLASSMVEGLEQSFWYLVILWTVLIVLLILISRSLRGREPDDRPTHRQDGDV
jgi:hypothetical protein